MRELQNKPELLYKIDYNTDYINVSNDTAITLVNLFNMYNASTKKDMKLFTCEKSYPVIVLQGKLTETGWQYKVAMSFILTEKERTGLKLLDDILDTYNGEI